MKEKDGYIDGPVMAFMDSLLNGRFGDLFEFDELVNFHNFLLTQAVAAGGFVLAFPTADLKMVWVNYEIDKEQSNRFQVTLNLPAEIHLTDEPKKPEELTEIPIWWKLPEEKEKHKPNVLH